MAEAAGKLTGPARASASSRAARAPTQASVGVHTAFQDSTPLLLLVGQIARGQRDREAFQEVDLPAFFGPLAKWAAEIDDAARIPELPEPRVPRRDERPPRPGRARAPGGHAARRGRRAGRRAVPAGAAARRDGGRRGAPPAPARGAGGRCVVLGGIASGARRPRTRSRPSPRRATSRWPASSGARITSTTRRRATSATSASASTRRWSSGSPRATSSCCSAAASATCRAAPTAVWASRATAGHAGSSTFTRARTS